MANSRIQTPDFPRDLRVALVHDWLTGMRGGERVLETLCKMFPAAEVFTLLHRPGSVSATIEKRRIHTSVLNRMPGVHRYYRWLLPLLPRCIEAMRIRRFDLVISLSHCVALGCRPQAPAKHICYCFSPMRYVWDQFEAYFASSRSSLLTRTAARMFARRLRRWDVAASQRVHHLVAISDFVAERIRRFYNREARVIHPGADTDFFSTVRSGRRNIALMVTALVPYKNVDLAIEAWKHLPLPLVIIGSGPSYPRLRRLAGPKVSFLGWQPDAMVRRYYSEARMLVFPGVEDFGLVPVEAMACGLPVLAYGRGGALETIQEPTCGLFFDEPTPEALAATALRMLGQKFDPFAIRRHALEFSIQRFVRSMNELIAESLRPSSG